MITDKQLKERQLDELYDWVDSLPLSRPKKNISRDFSDAVMMAETISIHFPKIVEIHNYPATSAVKTKLSNWVTLNNKVLSKIGLPLCAQDCKKLSNSTPLAIEAVLFQLKKFIDETNKEKEEEQKRFPDPFGNREIGRDLGNTGNQSIASKMYTASKVEQLREVLTLLKEKISLVERSIERKDGHIRELEQILKNYSN